MARGRTVLDGECERTPKKCHDSVLWVWFEILPSFGHRSFIRNKTQTVALNMTIKRMLENKVHLLDVFLCFDIHLQN